MDKPTPCPFCGFVCPRPHSRTAKTSGGMHHFVRCGSCNTEGPRSLNSQEEAIERWNRRAIVRAAAALAESDGSHE